MDKNQQAAADRLIPFKEVSRITGIKSLNTIKAKEDRGEFPLRRYLSCKCVRWSERQVLEYVSQLPNTFDEYKRRRNSVSQAVA